MEIEAINMAPGAWTAALFEPAFPFQNAPKEFIRSATGRTAAEAIANLRFTGLARIVINSGTVRDLCLS